jgi:hypothetical protein
MNSIRVDNSLATHPNTVRLARTLHIAVAHAVGHLVILWSWILDNAPDGDVSAFTSHELAQAAQWPARSADGFVAALRGTGWIDANGGVTGWFEIAGRDLANRARNTERMRRQRGQGAGRAVHVQHTCDARATHPLPSPPAPSPLPKPLFSSSPPAPLTGEAVPPAVGDGESGRQPASVDPATGTDGDVVVLEFPVKGAGQGGTWPLTASFLAELGQAYAGIDALAECRKAKLWIDANPERRKTSKGMKRFLAGWCDRAQAAPRLVARQTQSNQDDPAARIERALSEVLP